MTSKYDDFWRQRLGDVDGLLREAYESGASEELDVSAITSLGTRSSWYGQADVKPGTCVRAETAHMTSLSSVLAENHVLDKYAGVRFRFVLSTKLRLRATALNGQQGPVSVLFEPDSVPFQPAATLSEAAPLPGPRTPAMRRRQLAEILARLPYESWEKAVQNTPIWRFAQPFLGGYHYGPFAVLVVTAALNDYQLKGKAERVYWPELSAWLQQHSTPLTCAELEETLNPFYAEERFPETKLRRLGRFLSSPLAAELWASSPAWVSAHLQQIWQRLADTMGQQRQKKTICLAMKFLACSLSMAGETGFDFGSIPIPVDSRVLKFAQRAGICERYSDPLVRSACDQVLSLLRGREPRATMVHLDSLLWQIAGLTNDGLKDYFARLGAAEVGEDLAAFLVPRVSGALRTSRGGSCMGGSAYASGRGAAMANTDEVTTSLARQTSSRLSAVVKGRIEIVTMIELPFGGEGASFPVKALIRHIRDSGRNYIIQGQTHCVLAKHPKPQSLDAWLRLNFTDNQDIAQAVNSVVQALVATGYFAVAKFDCPDSGRECKGIKIVSA